MSAKFDIDLKLTGYEAVLYYLRRLTGRVEDISNAYTDIGEYLLRSHRERWDKQVSPDGTPWAPLSPGYLASKAKRTSRAPGKILVSSMYMRDSSMGYYSQGNRLFFGSAAKYAPTHQYGYAPKNIPARPFIGTSDADNQEIASILRTYIFGE